MVKFLVNIFHFIMFCSFLFILSIFSYVYIEKIDIHEIPALNFSDSYSFNEKIRCFKSRNTTDTIFAIGSSMTLNNIHSNTFIQKIRTSKFYNISSWGMSLSDDYQLLKYLSQNYNPRQIIIVSNIVDFQHGDKKINYNYVDSYLKGNNLKLMYHFVVNFNLIYYKENFEYAKKVRYSKRNYDYLNFDEFGTTNLSKVHLQVDSNRWKNTYMSNSLNEIQYNCLDSIVQFCDSKNIKLIFIQSPFREGLYTKFDKIEKQKLINHINRIISSIYAVNNKNIFIDSNEIIWSDTLFADAIHLNDLGAQIFTRFIVKKLDSANEKL